MGEETARLRREIDRTREDLTRDVDMITEKTSPSRIVERRVERTRRGIAGLKDRVMGHHDDDTTSGWGRGASASDPYGAGGSYREPVYGGGYGEQTGDWSRSGGPSTGERLRGGVGSARESVAGATSTMTSTVTERAQDVVHGVQGTAHDTVRTARHQTEGNPMAAGLVAFGVGWLVSSLLPASDREIEAARRAQQKAREHGGPIAEQAKQAAAEVGENLRGSAAEAVEQVKGHAQQAAQTVKDESASAAQTVKAEGTSAVQTVKDDAEGTSTTAGPAQGETY